MEVPSPTAGIVREISVAVGARISKGEPLMMIELAEGSPAPIAPDKGCAAPPSEPASVVAPQADLATPLGRQLTEAARATALATSAPIVKGLSLAGAIRLPHATPSVRAFAREIGADLSSVPASGPNDRVLRRDVAGFAKEGLSED